MSEGKLLHLRCFLEGEEVPIISCSVNAAIGSAASAHIELLDSEKGFELLPRTVVHVFFFDEYSGGKPDTSISNNKLSDSYRLLFAGEVFSIFHNKSAYGSRNLSIMCLDFSNVLDTNYIFQVGYSGSRGLTGTGDQATAQFLAGTSIGGNPFDDIVNSPQLVIQQMADKQASSPTHARRESRLGNLFAIFELLLGVEGHAMGMNIWTTIHERMVRLLDMIDADDGTTAKDLFDNQVFTSWVKNTINQQNPSMSYRELLHMIMGYIYYQMVPIPTASYFKPKGSSGREEFEVQKQSGRSVPEEYKQYFKDPVGEWSEAANIEPQFLANMIKVVQKLRADGWVDAKITDGYRTASESEALYGDPDYPSPHRKGVAVDISGNTGSPYDRYFGFAVNVALTTKRTLTRTKANTKAIDSLVENEYATKVGEEVKISDIKIIMFFLDRSEKNPSKLWRQQSDLLEDALFGSQIPPKQTFLFLHYMLVYPLFSRTEMWCPATSFYVDKQLKGQLVQYWKTQWEKKELLWYNIFGKARSISLWMGMRKDSKPDKWAVDFLNSSGSKEFFSSIFTGSSDGKVYIGGGRGESVYPDSVWNGNNQIAAVDPSYVGGLGQNSMWAQLQWEPPEDRVPKDPADPTVEQRFRQTWYDARSNVRTSNPIVHKGDAQAFSEIWHSWYDEKIKRWKQLEIEVNKYPGTFNGVSRKILRNSPPIYSVLGITGDDPVHVQLDDSGDYTTEVTVRSFAEARAQYEERERMSSFILRPDIWMCAPPKCNVIFPEDIVSLNISRELMRQTTRAFLMTYDELYADNVIFNGHYFAPQFEGDIPNIQQIAFGNSTSNEVLYPHEAYSGIIPKVSRMTEVAFYSRKKQVDAANRTDLSEDTAFLNSIKDLSPDAQLRELEKKGTAGITGTVRAYASNVAHYNLIKQRYSANRITISARFLPNFIPGFPSVVIGNKLAAVNHSEMLGTHTWLGMAESVQHSYSQGGANTSITLSTCRPYLTGPNSIDELLKLKKPGQNLFKNQSFDYISDPVTAEAGNSGEPCDLWDTREISVSSVELTRRFFSGGIFAMLEKSNRLWYATGLPLEATLTISQLVTKLINGDYFGKDLVTTDNRVNLSVRDFGEEIFNTPTPIYGNIYHGGKSVSTDSGPYNLKALGITDRCVHLTLNASAYLRDHIKSVVGMGTSTDPGDLEKLASRNEEFAQVQADAIMEYVTNNKITVEQGGKLKEIREVVPDLATGAIVVIMTRTWFSVQSAEAGEDPDLIEVKALPNAAPFSTTMYNQAKIEASINMNGSFVFSHPLLVPTPSFDIRLGDVVAEAEPSFLSEISNGIPLEEALMPPWIDDAYKNGKVDESRIKAGNPSKIQKETGIGALYRRWFGCDSILDDVTYTTEDAFEGNTVSVEMAVTNLINRYAKEHKDPNMKPPKSPSKYVRRNIATLRDMLAPVSNSELSSKEIPKTGGFHSRTVGNHDGLNLLGIVGKDLKASVAVDKKISIQPLTQEEKNKGLVLDPRPERRKRVIIYKNDVIKRRGRLG